MDAVEKLWMFHSDNISLFSQEEHQRQMRRYLTDTADDEMLAEWDTRSMKSRQSGG